MKTRKGIGGMGLLAIALAIGGGIVVGNFALSATGQGPSDGPVDDDAKASFDLKINEELADTQPNYVNASYYIYNPEGIEVASGTTDTASGFSTITDLKENTEYTIRVQDDDGSGSDYYYSERTVETSETREAVIRDVKKEGSVTTEISETSGSSDDDDTIKVNQGATETFTVEVEENTKDAAFRQPALVVKTNDTDAVSDLEVQGATQEDVPDRLSSFDDLYDPGTSEIVDFADESYDVQVTRGDSNTDPATVDVTVVDSTHFQDDTGAWVDGFEDSNDNDVGAGDTSTNTVTVKN